MTKIPLEKAIGGAYRFLFSNIVSVLGIIWLPYLVFFGLGGAVLWYGLTHNSLAGLSVDPKHLNLAPLIPVLRLFPLAVFLFLVGEFIATIGLVRKALGLMEGTTFIFFTLGAPLWRFIGAVFLIYLILIAVVCGFALATFGWARFGQNHIASTPLRTLIGVLGIVFMACLFVYIIFRLTFFLPAVIVAENRIGIGRSWTLGGGNFWRIIVTLLMVVLPTAIAFGFLNSIVSTALYGPMPMPNFGGNPDAQQAAIVAFYKAAFARSLQPGVFAVQLLSAIAIRALYAGAVANAYRSVTPTVPAPAA